MTYKKRAWASAPFSQTPGEFDETRDAVVVDVVDDDDGGAAALPSGLYERSPEMDEYGRARYSPDCAPLQSCRFTRTCARARIATPPVRFL